MSAIEFQGWPKTPRLNKDIVITEKMDGSNAAVIIEQHPFGTSLESEDPYLLDVVLLDLNDETGLPEYEYHVGAQSRKRLIRPGEDNYGFAGWVKENAFDLATALGPGRHFGEWWGLGIQRRYDLDHKRFSLFNTHRYSKTAFGDFGLHQVDTVPVIYQGPFGQDAIDRAVENLRDFGSYHPHADGFDPAEGVIVFHSASKQVYKVLLENDHLPKGLAA
jgi:hypothetical protein